MNIEEYCDAINKDMKLTYYSGQSRWVAKIEHAEVKADGGMLKSEYGEGNTPARAVAAYATMIRGQTLVFSAMSDARVELNVPDSLATGERF